MTFCIWLRVIFPYCYQAFPCNLLIRLSFPILNYFCQKPTVHRWERGSIYLDSLCCSIDKPTPNCSDCNIIVSIGMRESMSSNVFFLKNYLGYSRPSEFPYKFRVSWPIPTWQRKLARIFIGNTLRPQINLEKTDIITQCWVFQIMKMVNLSIYFIPL